jgi:hypothetical protein
MHGTGTSASAVALSALLDEGTWTLSRSQLARDLATTLGQEARQLVWTSHELMRASRELVSRPISAVNRTSTPTRTRGATRQSTTSARRRSEASRSTSRPARLIE